MIKELQERNEKTNKGTRYYDSEKTRCSRNRFMNKHELLKNFLFDSCGEKLSERIYVLKRRLVNRIEKSWLTFDKKKRTKLVTALYTQDIIKQQEKG